MILLTALFKISSYKLSYWRYVCYFIGVDFMCAFIIIYQSYSFCCHFVMKSTLSCKHTCHRTKDKFAILLEIGLTNCCDI